MHVRHVEIHHSKNGGTQRQPTPQDYAKVFELLETGKLTVSTQTGTSKELRFKAEKEFGGETLKAVFEVRSGKRTRSISLVTLVVKTAKKK